MSQSEVMVGTLIAAFVLFLLMRNRLAAYWALLTGGGTSVAQSGSGTGQPAVTTPGNATTGVGGSVTNDANVKSFVPNTVQQLGNIWVWKDAISGATRIDHNPPPGYTPPTGQ